LSRDLEFIAHLQKSSVKFVVADMPDANHLTVQLLAALAQHEREMISTRTREALAAKTKASATDISPSGTPSGTTAG
jgi:DNA invertase Pin-like site-specific DNA recombinase